MMNMPEADKNHALQGLRNFATTRGDRAAFSTVSVALRPLDMDLACRQIANERARRALGYLLGQEVSAPAEQTALDTVQASVSAWLEKDARSHVESFMINGTPLLDRATEEADTFLAQAKGSWGPGWLLRVCEEAERHATALDKDIDRAAYGYVFGASEGLWANLGNAPLRLASAYRIGAAYLAYEYALRYVAQMRAEAGTALTEASEELASLQVRKREIATHAHAALGQRRAPAQQVQAAEGLFALLKSWSRKLLEAPVQLDRGDEEKAHQRLATSLEGRVREIVVELYQATALQTGLQSYLSQLRSFEGELEAGQVQAGRALELVREVALEAVAEKQCLHEQLLALGDSLNADADVMAAVRARAGQVAPKRTVADWFENLGIAKSPLDIGAKRQVAFGRLQHVTVKPLAQLARKQAQEILVALPLDSLARLFNSMIEEVQKRVLFDEGQKAAPTVQIVVGIPGGGPDSALGNLLRGHGLVPIVNTIIEASPYPDSLMVCALAQGMSLLQLPGMQVDFESYLLLPEHDENHYDRAQAWSDKRCREIFEALCVSRERLLEVILHGLAFGKILDTKAQPGRKSDTALIKLVPDAEVTTAFDEARGHKLQHMVTLGTSIPTLIETLATHPEYVAEIEDYVHRCVEADGQNVVLQRLRELDASERYRKDIELTARLKDLLGKEQPGA
jgi:hypothetical protein